MNKYTKSIKRNAAIGLWGSAAAVIVTGIILFANLWPHTPSTYTSRWMLIAGAVLAVLALSMSLLVIRKQIPALRQSENLEAKLSGYAQHIRSLYLTMLAVVVLICIFTLLSTKKELLMLAMVATLMLILAYPNIYRIKVELGLTDDEMKSLYGDQYIAEEKGSDNVNQS